MLVSLPRTQNRTPFYPTISNLVGLDLVAKLPDYIDSACAVSINPVVLLSRYVQLTIDKG